MNVQLLLLLALAGPLCAFPHANHTDVTTEPYVGTTQTVAEVTLDTSESPRENHTVVTGPPPTEPATAHQEVTTEVVTKAVVDTEASVAATTAAAPEPLITDSPIEGTTATVEEMHEKKVEEATAADTGEEVLVEEDTEEGLSTGQVVGIVIGCLLAVVIVIAVVIAVVRRMGKYSP